MNYFFFLSSLLVCSLQLEAQNTNGVISENSCSRIYPEPETKIIKLYSNEYSGDDDFIETYENDTLVLEWEMDGSMKEYRLQGLHEMVESYTTVDSIYLYDITQNERYEAFVFFNTTFSRDGWSSGWYESFDYLCVWELTSMKQLLDSEIELGTYYDTWELSSLPPEDLSEDEFDHYMDTVAYSYDSLLYKCEIAFHLNTFQLFTNLIYDSYGDEELEEGHSVNYRYQSGKLKEEDFDPLNK